MKTDKIRKITAALLSVVMVLCFSSCGSDVSLNGEETADDTNDTVSAGKARELTENVGADMPDPDKYGEYYAALTENKETGESVRKTSYEIFKKFAEDELKSGENTLISPLSFLAAMGMLESGADGRTLAEIEDTFGMKADEFSSWYKAWQSLLNSGESSGGLRMANSLWYRDPSEGLSVKDDFLGKIAGIFRAQAFIAPFDDSTVSDVNKWAGDNTDGMIDNVIDELDPDCVMLLMNAACFEGEWLDDYQDDSISENEDFIREDGTCDKVTMLSSVEGRASYFRNDSFSASRKYYNNGYYIMFMLPNEGKSIGDVLGVLNGDEPASLFDSEYGQVADVDLTVPEFKFDFEVKDAMKSLMDMGIRRVFDPDNAELGSMAVMETGENLYVNSIIHKTHIELDREGTRAAAVTDIGVNKVAAAPVDLPRVELRLDRPFIFMICDTDTDTPFFIGTVSKIE